MNETRAPSDEPPPPEKGDDAEVASVWYNMDVLLGSPYIEAFSGWINAGSTDGFFSLLTEFLRTVPDAIQTLADACAARNSELYQKRTFELQGMLLPIGAVGLLWDAEQAAQSARREHWEKCAQQADAVALGIMRLCEHVQSAVEGPDAAPRDAGKPAAFAGMFREFKRKKILAVDDKPDILHSVNFILKREYEVFGATNHMAALGVLAHNAPDLILLDIEMPDKDGFSLLGLIRKIRGYETTPVLFLTSSVNAENILRSQAAGGSGFIRKPIDAQVLLAKIRGLIG